MTFLRELMQDNGVKKFFAILFLIGLLITIKNLFNLLLLTFIFTFLFSNVQTLIFNKIKKFVPIKEGMVTILLYVSTTIGLVVVIIKYVPLLVKQLVSIGTQVSNFSLEVYAETLDPRVFNLIKGINVEEYLKTGGEALMGTVAHAGEFGIHLVLALLLSLFFLLEKEEVKKFGLRLEQSKIAFFYNYYKFFGEKFLNSFGKVLQVQILISFINAILSVIMLAFIGFNQVIGLGFMIFVLGLIPVAGVIISFIPISVIAFTLGGISKVALVVIMILILHALESYLLNPKLMSMTTKLPVFFTFIILILGEHFLGIWGLLVGLPLFMFLLDIMDVKAENEKK